MGPNSDAVSKNELLSEPGTETFIEFLNGMEFLGTHYDPQGCSPGCLIGGGFATLGHHD